MKPSPTERLHAINYNKITQMGQYCLNETWTMTQYDPPKITGVIIVGSTLTDSFTFGESDLDIFYIINAEQDTDQYQQKINNHKEPVRRIINDSNTRTHTEINQSIPNYFTQIDCLGFVTEQSINHIIEEPYNVMMIEQR